VDGVARGRGTKRGLVKRNSLGENTVFKFSSLAHALATAAQTIVSEAKLIETVIAKVQGQAPLIETLTGFVSPQAVLIERAAFGILGKVSHAVIDAGAAASQSGLNVQFDAAEIADLREISRTLLAHPIVQTSGVMQSPADPAKH
jgi:hypothetical protein